MTRLLLVALFYSTVVFAGNNEAIPTCYNENIPAKNGATNVELFVIVDQTTYFDGNLKQSIADNIRPFLKPGNAFSVTEFSAFIQGHYTEVLVSGRMDSILDNDARDDTGKPSLSKFDNCMGNQAKLARQVVGNALKISFGSDVKIHKSDILASLKDISSKVRQSTAKNKVVLIASDMLENSSISSFYTKQAVRQINVDYELKLVADSNLFGDFGGASIYVIGAGLIADDSKSTNGIYRSQQVMRSLSTFWKTWFQQSNAELVEFGQPALLNPVR